MYIRVTHLRSQNTSNFLPSFLFFPRGVNLRGLCTVELLVLVIREFLKKSSSVLPACSQLTDTYVLVNMRVQFWFCKTLVVFTTFVTFFHPAVKQNMYSGLYSHGTILPFQILQGLHPSPPSFLSIPFSSFTPRYHFSYILPPHLTGRSVELVRHGQTGG